MDLTDRQTMEKETSPATERNSATTAAATTTTTTSHSDATCFTLQADNTTTSTTTTNTSSQSAINESDSDASSYNPLPTAADVANSEMPSPASSGGGDCRRDCADDRCRQSSPHQMANREDKPTTASDTNVDSLVSGCRMTGGDRSDCASGGGGDDTSSLQLLAQLAEDALSSDTEDAFSECPDDLAESLYANLVAHGEQSDDIGDGNGDPLDLHAADPHGYGRSSSIGAVCFSTSASLTTSSCSAEPSGIAGQCRPDPSTMVEATTSIQATLRAQSMRLPQYSCGTAATTTCWSDRVPENQHYWVEPFQHQQQRSDGEMVGSSEDPGGVTGLWSMGETHRSRTGNVDHNSSLDVRLSTSVDSEVASPSQNYQFLSHPGFYYDPVGMYSSNPIYASSNSTPPTWFYQQQQQQHLQFVQSQNSMAQQNHHLLSSPPQRFSSYQQPSRIPSYHSSVPSSMGQTTMSTSVPSTFAWPQLTMPDVMSTFPSRQQQQPSQSTSLQLTESFLESFANKGIYGGQSNYVDGSYPYPPAGHLTTTTTTNYGERPIQQPAFMSNALTHTENSAWYSRSGGGGGQIPCHGLRAAAEHHQLAQYTNYGNSASSQSRSSSASTGVNSIRSPSLDTPPPLDFQSPSPPRHYSDQSLPSDPFSQHPGLHHSPFYGLPTPTGHHHKQHQQTASLGFVPLDSQSAAQQCIHQWFDEADAESSVVLDMRTKTKHDETDTLHVAPVELGQSERMVSTVVEFSENGSSDKRVEAEFVVDKNLPESSVAGIHPTVAAAASDTTPGAAHHLDPTGVMTELAVCRSPCSLCRKSVPRFQILSEPVVSSAATGFAVPPLPTFASQFAGLAKLPLTTMSGQPMVSVARQENGERNCGARKPKKTITVKQMLLNRSQYPPPPPFVGGVGNLRPYPSLQPPISNAPASILHPFHAGRAASNMPAPRSVRLPYGRPPGILSRYPLSSATATTTSDMSFLVQPPAGLQLPPLIQLGGDTSSSRSLLKSSLEPPHHRHIIASSTVNKYASSQPYPFFIVPNASTNYPPESLASHHKTAVGQGSEVSSSAAPQSISTAAVTPVSSGTQLRHLLSRDVVVRPSMPPPKRVVEDMRRTRSMFPNAAAAVKVAPPTTTSSTSEDANTSFVVVPPLKMEMPRLFPASAAVSHKSEHADNRPPRHFDMEAIQIGTFRIGRSHDHRSRNKLKIFFSKRKLVYEFSVEHWRLLPLTNPPMVPYMAAIDIPFAIVTAIHCNEEQILVAVSEAPKQYVGARPSRVGAGVNFDRNRPYDVTGGQIAVCHIHKISLKKRQGESLRFQLESIDERFKTLLTAPIFEAIADIDATATSRLGVGPVIELSRKPTQENNDKNVVPPVTKHCIIEVITPKVTAQSVEGSTGILCHCQVSCRSNRCSCMKSKSKCGMGSPSCLCKDCDNPLNLFETMGISLEAVLLDSCLLQRIITFRGDVSALLETTMTFPCCMYQAPMKVCIPGQTPCPNEDCSVGASYKFSWCNMQLCDEDSNPRNHCTACRACKDPTELHCDVCRRCLPMEGKDTRCPSCFTLRELDFTEQGDMANLMYRCRQAQHLRMPLLLPITTASTTTTITTTTTFALAETEGTSKTTGDRGVDARQLAEQESAAGGSAAADINCKELPPASALSAYVRKGAVRSVRNRRTTSASAAALATAEEERLVVPAKKRRTTCGRPRNKSR